MTRETKLSIGQRCWYLDSGTISFVDVTERADYLVGERQEFSLYAVKRCVSGRVVFTSVHRSTLFAVPDEREALINRLKDLERRMHDYRLELSSQENDYIPDPEKDEV